MIKEKVFSFRKTPFVDFQESDTSSLSYNQLKNIEYSIISYLLRWLWDHIKSHLPKQLGLLYSNVKHLMLVLSPVHNITEC